MSRFIVILLALPLWAHDPITTKLTWTREISRIVYQRCAGCHKDLAAYQTARPWAKAIRDEVTSRRMPPWGAVEGVGEFAGNRALTNSEIEMLVGWVEGGAPEGDPAYLPARIPVAEAEPAVPPHGRSVAVERELVLKNAARIVALRPRGLPDHGSLEAWTVGPDGAIERLIWLRDYRKVSTRNYVEREPVFLPAGTRLRIVADPGAALMVYLK